MISRSRYLVRYWSIVLKNETIGLFVEMRKGECLTFGDMQKEGWVSGKSE